MRAHHALGRAGGARGVDDQLRVVVTHAIDRRRRRVGRLELGQRVRMRARRADDERVRGIGPVHDVGRHLRQARRDGADAVGPLFVDDHAHRVRLVDEVAQHLALGSGVDRHRNRPDLAEPPDDPEELGTVRQHHRHVVAVTDPARCEAVRIAVRRRLQIGVAERTPLPEKKRAVGNAPCLVGKHAADRALLERVVANLHGALVDRCPVVDAGSFVVRVPPVCDSFAE